MMCEWLCIVEAQGGESRIFFVMPSFSVLFHVTVTTRLIALIIIIAARVCAGSRAKPLTAEQICKK